MTSGEDEASSSVEVVSAAAARAQVARILNSHYFAKAERLKRFLHFVTEQTLKGLSRETKETVIGIEVFDRRAATFDPRIDPIVRVQAGRVRAKLADYYSQEGVTDRVLVELPSGQYTPRFSVQSLASARALAALTNAEQAARQSRTIAVLPFVNIGDDPANRYFSDGLTEELIHALARLPSIRITARRAAFRFRQRDYDLGKVGRLLGAGKIVKGSIGQTNDRLRIAVELVNVDDGHELWSRTYERAMGDVFALQEEIARAIQLALSGLSGERQVPMTAPSTRSVGALNQYLLGRFHWNKRDEVGFRAALAHFQSAIEIDPGYGRAYSGIADCYIMLAVSGVETPSACMPLAQHAAQRAVEIDERSVEAHTSLGVVRANFYWDWTGSEVEFQQAIEIDPTYPTLHHWYCLYSLAPLGRFDEAEEEIEWGERLDPTSLTINLAHGQLLYLSGDFHGAIAHCQKALRLDGRYYRSYWWMGLAENQLGNFDAASDALETAKARGRGDMAFRARILGALGHTYARWGKLDRALATLDELAAMSRSNYVDPFEIAHVQAGLGRANTALDSLEQAAADRSGFVVYIGVWPAFEDLHGHARFRALLDRMALARKI